MKMEDIRKMSADEMAAKLGEFRKELFDLRFKHATNQLENTQRMKVVKRTIAKILTVMTETAKA